MLTGKYAWRKKGTGIGDGDSPLIIDTDRVTIADVMHDAGYATAAIGKWHLGLGSGPNGANWDGVIKPGPLELGFDYSFLMPATPDRVPTVYVQNHHIFNLNPKYPVEINYKHAIGHRPTAENDPMAMVMQPDDGHAGTIINGIPRIGWMSGGQGAVWNDSTISQVMTGQVVSFIKKNQHHPFFIYFASHDVHVPRVPAAQFVGKSGMGPRGDELLELDWEVGQIESTLKELHIAKNTLVIFTSDNGPVLDDGYKDGAVQLARQPITTPYNKNLLPPATAADPYPRLPEAKPAGPLRGGKYSILEGGTRIPFIVDWPGHTKKGMVSHALVSQVDLLASFAALTHQEIAPTTGPDSLNMLPVLLGESTTGRHYLVAQTNTPTPLALFEDGWKYVQPDNQPAFAYPTHTELGNSPTPQLYDLRTDIGEKRNLAKKYPLKVKAMELQLQKIAARQTIRTAGDSK